LILKPYKYNQKCFVGHSLHSSIFGHPQFVILAMPMSDSAYLRQRLSSRLTAIKLPARAGPDYGLGIVGKCLGPTTSNGPTKDCCKYFEHTLANQSLMFYAL